MCWCLVSFGVLLKRDTNTGVFCEYSGILKTPILTNQKRELVIRECQDLYDSRFHYRGTPIGE